MLKAHQSPEYALPHDQQHDARNAPSLAAMAALAYSLVVVYASLQPFGSWRALPGNFGAFLLEPWPRWITFDDVLFNFLAYVPLGFLLALALHVRRNMQGAVAGAAVICALLSGALEAVQQYLPSRIASNVDLLVNAAGGTAGALIAPLFAPGRHFGRRLAQLRSRWVVDGLRGDAVLVLAGLWVVAQLHASTVAFGSGDLRGSLSLPALFTFTPQSYLVTEAGVVMLNAAGLGLLLAGVARSTGTAYWRALLLLLGAACALKAAAVLLVMNAPNPWSWLTPGVIGGFGGALAALLLLTRLPPRARTALALLALGAAVALVNGVPENPYRPVPAYLLLGRTSHILSFASMTHALSDLWPFLAMLCALPALTARSAPSYRD